MGFGFYIFWTQRCWWWYIFPIHKIWRRDVTRRYFFGKHTIMGGFIYCKYFIRSKYNNVKIYYCMCFIVVWDDVVCSVACSVDVNDSFLLFVEMSSDVFAEDLPSCFWFCQIKKHGLGLSFRDKWLISCFSHCGIFTNMPHSKNTQSSRFSSKYPRKLLG